MGIPNQEGSASDSTRHPKQHQHPSPAICKRPWSWYRNKLRSRCQCKSMHGLKPVEMIVQSYTVRPSPTSPEHSQLTKKLLRSANEQPACTPSWMRQLSFSLKHGCLHDISRMPNLFSVARCLLFHHHVCLHFPWAEQCCR